MISSHFVSNNISPFIPLHLAVDVRLVSFFCPPSSAPGWKVKWDGSRRTQSALELPISKGKRNKRPRIISWSIYISGQIIIFHQPRFSWNKGISLTIHHHLGWKLVWGRYNFIWPDLYMSHVFNGRFLEVNDFDERIRSQIRFEWIWWLGNSMVSQMFGA